VVFGVSERVPDDVAATPVERAETEVMFLRTEDEPVEMRRGWERLEAVVGLHGRTSVRLIRRHRSTACVFR
jgi:hypothetical protein